MTKIIVVGASGTIGSAAALDLAPDIRLNAVSPILVIETARRMGMDAAGSMSATETARAYQASIDGDMTGQVLDVRDFGTIEKN